jgi:hypothetical protein
MKKLILTLALAGLASSPLLAQTRTRAPVPGTHDRQGELVLYGSTNFAGQSQTISRDSPTVSTPFAIRSLAIKPGDRWQVCANPNFQPPCTTVQRPIADATIIGVTGQVGSIRLIPDPNAAAN